METNYTELQNEVKLLNKKLDNLIKISEIQQRRNSQMDDLFQDLTFIGNGVFNYAIEELDNQQIKINPEEIKFLLFRFIKNIDNINKVVSFLESSNDLLKDLSPIVNSIGMDAINLMALYESKGAFRIFDNLKNNAESLTNIFYSLTQPSFIQNMEKILKTISTLKIDDVQDDKSLYKIYKQMKKPEVRKFISFMLRAIEEVNKN